MAYRATKSGINADQTKKVSSKIGNVWLYWPSYSVLQQDAAYSQEAEVQARQWIEQITEEEIGPDFFSGLKDGSHLCRLQQNDLCLRPTWDMLCIMPYRLLNKLRPGLVASKYETPNTQPFKQVSLASCAQYVSNDVNYIYCTVLFSWRPLVSSWMDAGSMASLRKICLWLSTSMRCVTRTWYDQTVWPDTAPIDPIHYS